MVCLWSHRGGRVCLFVHVLYALGLDTGGKGEGGLSLGAIVCRGLPMLMGLRDLWLVIC